MTNKSCVLLSIWSLTYDVSGKDKLSRSIPNICQASWTGMRHIIWGEHVQHVFTHAASQTSLSSWKIEDVLSDDIISWRNYCDKPRSWEKGGPSPGEQNEVIRCFGSQTKSKRVTCMLQRRQLRNDLPQKHKVWARLPRSGVERNS